MSLLEYGQPLALVDVPEPDVPRGHALIDVLTCGVCATDLKIVGGSMPFSDQLRLPHVPGHEIFGRVIRTEPPGMVESGTTVVVYQYRSCGRCASCMRGDEVLCQDMRTWTGFVDPGGFQERVVAAVDRLVVVPPTVPAVRGAPLSCAIGTAYRAVVTRGRVRAGDAVVVIGLGGVGIHAAQFALASGAAAWGIDPHGATQERAAELGIAVASDADPLGSILVQHASGVDTVVDTVATEDTMELATGLVRRGGSVVVVGHGINRDARIATRRLVLDEIRLIGSRYATRREMTLAVAAVANGRIQPIVGLVRPLEEIDDVLDALRAGNVVGRAVVDVAGVA